MSDQSRDYDHERELQSEGPLCPQCNGPTKIGFGLAGGGYGAYAYCETCGIVAEKWQEPLDE